MLSMTLVNRLIRQAKDGAEVLVVRDDQVRTIAAHAHALMACNRPTIEDIEAEIREGRALMCGIPLCVRNNHAPPKAA